MKFTSTVYKELVLHDFGVTFIDGDAEVRDKANAPRALPADLGVRAVGGRPANDRATSYLGARSGSKLGAPPCAEHAATVLNGPEQTSTNLQKSYFCRSAQ